MLLFFLNFDIDLLELMHLPKMVSLLVTLKAPLFGWRSLHTQENSWLQSMCPKYNIIFGCFVGLTCQQQHNVVSAFLCVRDNFLTMFNKLWQPHLLPTNPWTIYKNLFQQKQIVLVLISEGKLWALFGKLESIISPISENSFLILFVFLH